MESTSRKKVLVVEDDPDILNLITLYLDKAGYRSLKATTGLEALAQIKTEHPDMVVLDLMLPEIDGLDVCKRLRADVQTATLPIIMVTAKAEESDTVIGLELGADDYVTKPFSPKALIARVKALFRRVERAQEEPTVWTYGPILLDSSRHEVKVGKEDVSLTAKEFGLLAYLLRHPGRVLTRDVLLNTIWGYDYYGTTRTVDVHVRRLKQKIPLLDDAIISIKSLGYKLKDQQDAD
jgi:DNA-binding response OmpR family regulator